MKDQEALERREQVFEELRQAVADYEKMEQETISIYNRFQEMQAERDKKRNQAMKLKRLVDSMILHDCCPVEAKLKYPEEIEDLRDDGVIEAQADYAMAKNRSPYLSQPSKKSLIARLTGR